MLVVSWALSPIEKWVSANTPRGSHFEFMFDYLADACGPRKTHRILSKEIARTVKTTRRHIAMIRASDEYGRSGLRQT